MPSSIFNSICLAMAFLASSTSAQPVDLGNWAQPKYQNTTTNFQAGATDDITLTYLIGTEREWNISLFAPDCTSDINITIPNPYDDQANLTTRTIEVYGGNQDLLEISINLDKTEITSSNIWVNNTLKFCVSLQLWSGGSIFKEDLRIIDITFDYDVEFEADSGVGLTTGPLLTSPAMGGDEATVDSYISACQCVLGSYECVPSTLGVDDTLEVCVKSSNPDVELKSLTNLTLFQGTTGEELLVVQNDVVEDAQVAWMISSGALVKFVESVVPTRFFRTTDGSLTVLGQVEVKFKGSRRLVSFEYANNPTSTAATRDMRGDTVSRPGFSRFKQGTADEESTDPQEVSESSNFGFTVGLVTTEDDKDDTLDEMFPENSGTHAKEETPFLFLLVVVWFAWAMFGNAD